MALVPIRAVWDRLDIVLAASDNPSQADVNFIAEACRDNEILDQLKDWCPELRPEDNDQLDIPSNAIQALRQALWSPEDFKRLRTASSREIPKQLGYIAGMWQSDLRIIDGLFDGIDKQEAGRCMAALDELCDDRTGAQPRDLDSGLRVLRKMPNLDRALDHAKDELKRAFFLITTRRTCIGMAHPPTNIKKGASSGPAAKRVEKVLESILDQAKRWKHDASAG